MHGRWKRGREAAEGADSALCYSQNRRIVLYLSLRLYNPTKSKTNKIYNLIK